MKVRSALIAAVAMTSMAFASSAMAESVHAQLVGLAPSWGAATLTQDAGAHWEAGGVGQLQWGNAAWSPAPGQSTFWTYCIQISSQINYNVFYDYTVTPLASSPDLIPLGNGNDKALGIESMFGWVQDNTAGNDLTLLTDIQKMALQVAVWEIVYDGRSAVVPAAWNTAGNFRMGNYNSDLAPVIAAAATYLSHEYYTLPMTLVGLVGDHQNQVITSAPSAPPAPVVPLPSTSSAVLVLLGVSGFLTWSSRKRGVIG